jgi:hypothetical protein
MHILMQVLLFTDKATTTVLYQALSWAYQHRLAFSEVRTSALSQEEGSGDSSSGSLAQEYGVTDSPALVLLKVLLPGCAAVTCLLALCQPTQQ